jgi:protein-disulfide isomerase
MTDSTTPDREPGPPAVEPASTTLDPAPALPLAPDPAAEPSVPTEAPWPSDAPLPSGAAVTEARRDGPRRLAVLGFLGAVALGAVIGAAGLGLATGTIGAPAPSPSPAPTAEPTAEATAAPAAPVGNTFGRADAPVTIDVWADYQCPYCRLEDLLFGGAIDREYVTPGIARVVYRDFAFLGQESIDAAVASRCAGAQEPAAQLRYHDALYTFQQGENEGRFARENLLQVAEIAGVPSKDAFTACLDDPAVAKAVTDETTAGRNVGVTSTPTLRLRGPGGERVLTGFSQTWPPLREAIEAVRVAASPAPSPAPSPANSPAGSPAPSSSP